MDTSTQDFLKQQKAEVEKNEAKVPVEAIAKLEKKQLIPLATMTDHAFKAMSALNRHDRRKYFKGHKHNEAFFVPGYSWEEVNNELKDRLMTMGVSRFLKGL